MLRKPASGEGEKSRKFFESTLDPYLAIARAFAEQESATHAAGDAVIPTITEGSTRRARAIVLGGISWGGRRGLPKLFGRVNSALSVLDIHVLDNILLGSRVVLRRFGGRMTPQTKRRRSANSCPLHCWRAILEARSVAWSQCWIGIRNELRPGFLRFPSPGSGFQSGRRPSVNP
jgi:hypothetical protein